MKYYIAQINERNGEYTYEHTIALACSGDPVAALIKLAANWYEDEDDYLENYGEPLHDPLNVDQGHYYYNGGEVCCSVGYFKEVKEAFFNALPNFIQRYECD